MHKAITQNPSSGTGLRWLSKCLLPNPHLSIFDLTLSSLSKFGNDAPSMNDDACESKENIHISQGCSSTYNRICPLKTTMVWWWCSQHSRPNVKLSMAVEAISFQG